MISVPDVHGPATATAPPPAQETSPPPLRYFKWVCKLIVWISIVEPGPFIGRACSIVCFTKMARNKRLGVW